MHRVFIYGTLKRGFPNHQGPMKAFAFPGRFRTLEAFPLVVGGKWYSPYLIDEPGQGHRVFGEVYAVDDAGLAWLDEIEGTPLPAGYRRIAIALGDGAGGRPFDAWTYVKDRRSIEGRHSAPMADYAPDPNYVPPSKRDRVF